MVKPKKLTREVPLRVAKSIIYSDLVPQLSSLPPGPLTTGVIRGIANLAKKRGTQKQAGDLIVTEGHLREVIQKLHERRMPIKEYFEWLYKFKRMGWTPEYKLKIAIQEMLRTNPDPKSIGLALERGTITPTQARELMQTINARNLLEDFASNVDSVYLSGNNASRYYVLPETLSGGVVYMVRVYPKSILISYDYGGAKYYSTRIFAGNINNTNYVELVHGRTRIINVDNMIYFENEA